MRVHFGVVFAVVSFAIGLGVAGVEYAILAAIFGFFVGKLAVSTTRTLRVE